MLSSRSVCHNVMGRAYGKPTVGRGSSEGNGWRVKCLLFKQTRTAAESENYKLNEATKEQIKQLEMEVSTSKKPDNRDDR